MRTLEEILHPVTPAQFRAEYEGRQPLHIPAAEGSDKRALLPWDAFNGLLNQSNVWDSERLKLMRHDDSVPPEQYCRRKLTPEGMIWRPLPAKVEVFLSAGASILANDVLTLHSPITKAGVALGEAREAEVGVEDPDEPPGDQPPGREGETPTPGGPAGGRGRAFQRETPGGGRQRGPPGGRVGIPREGGGGGEPLSGSGACAGRRPTRRARRCGGTGGRTAGRWGPPGGGVESGARAETAADRLAARGTSEVVVAATRADWLGDDLQLAQIRLEVEHVQVGEGEVLRRVLRAIDFHFVKAGLRAGGGGEGEPDELCLHGSEVLYIPPRMDRGAEGLLRAQGHRAGHHGESGRQQENDRGGGRHR